MKKLVFFAVITILTQNIFAAPVEGANTKKTITPVTITAPMKKIDITVQSGGYTIHIVGSVSYSLNGNISINATITISGGGISVSYPFVYTGGLTSAKGSNKNVYSDKGIADEDKQAVGIIISHIFLPADVDPRLTKIE